MFASTKSLGVNPKLYFFNDKELLAMGSISERFVHQFLELLVNPTAVTPHTNIFSMTKKNKFVATTCMVEVTPAQQTLLNLVSHREAEDYFKALQSIHFTSTYCVDKDLLDLPKNGMVHELLNALQAISTEQLILNFKNQ